MSEKKNYSPPFRILIDLIVLGNALIFLNFLFNMIRINSMESTLIVYNSAALIFWIVIRLMLKVKVQEGKITGPSIFFLPTSILLRKVDVHRSCKKTPFGKFFGYQDIWSIDGRSRVRMFRRFFERQQFHSLIKEIEKHPFHEGSSQ